MRDGFGDLSQDSTALIAEWEGAAAGFALYFYNYSTWKGRPGILSGRSSSSGLNIAARALERLFLLHVARIAVAENCGRYEWQVLDWNTPAIEFYEGLGAQRMKQWLPMRVEGKANLLI